jgi:hypothetical protein
MEPTLIDSNPEIGNEAQETYHRKLRRNVLGQKFGRLTVLNGPISRRGRNHWFCSCQCGNTTVVAVDKLISGHTRSCGCLEKETTPALTHGESRNGKVSGRLHMFLAAKARAKKSDILFTIQLSDLIIPEKCPILGIPLFFGTGKCSENSPSLDQIKPGAGYTPDNIQIISHKANTMKSNATFEQFEMLYFFWKSQRERLKREALETAKQ